MEKANEINIPRETVRGAKSTLEHFSRYFFYLKSFGVFPVKLAYGKGCEGAQVFLGIGADNRVWVQALNYGMEIYLILRCLFIIFQLSGSNLGAGDAWARIIAPSISILGSLIVAIAILHTFRQKKKEILLLLNQWHFLEMKVWREGKYFRD